MSLEHGTDSHKLTKQQLIAKLANCEEFRVALRRQRDDLQRERDRLRVMVEALHRYIEGDD